jgi:hypothetical protein
VSWNNKETWRDLKCAWVRNDGTLKGLARYSVFHPKSFCRVLDVEDLPRKQHYCMLQVVVSVMRGLNLDDLNVLEWDGVINLAVSISLLSHEYRHED